MPKAPVDIINTSPMSRARKIALLPSPYQDISHADTT